ncbi:hypothetical protein MTBBW1_2130032 [Desulfamplus magnetovallimortis]|uniref:Uncharacterized protein n=1 Tax=Desulfamplus magnetovallimortis TaxID=1246637 RepID=A0A1W1HCC5_9BACT|nr:hypothetical protein MTBBW1_2130032 [Desulfamplus magnetovallimortis]
MLVLCLWRGTLFIITYMADYRHNRRDESLYENRYLRGLSYKILMIARASQRWMKVFICQYVMETF